MLNQKNKLKILYEESMDYARSYRDIKKVTKPSEEVDCFSLAVDYLLANGVIVPPCKVGDTVYTNFAMSGWYFRDKDKPYSAKVVFMGLNNSEEMGGGLINVVYGKHDKMMQFRFSDIGKSVFLTREEAEQALERGVDNAE